MGFDVTFLSHMYVICYSQGEILIETVRIPGSLGRVKYSAGSKGQALHGISGLGLYQFSRVSI